MRRFSIRWRGGHRDPEVEREAHEDLIFAEIEGRLRTRIEELEQREAHLLVLLSRAQLGEWMWWGVARRNAAQRLEATRVISRRDLSAPTEYVPRRYR